MVLWTPQFWYNEVNIFCFFFQIKISWKTSDGRNQANNREEMRVWILEQFPILALFGCLHCDDIENCNGNSYGWIDALCYGNLWFRFTKLSESKVFLGICGYQWASGTKVGKNDLSLENPAKCFMFSIETFLKQNITAVSEIYVLIVSKNRCDYVFFGSSEYLGSDITNQTNNFLSNTHLRVYRFQLRP